MNLFSYIKTYQHSLVKSTFKNNSIVALRSNNNIFSISKNNRFYCNNETKRIPFKTGLTLVNNPRELLIERYEELKKTLEKHLDKDNVYRKYVENIVNFRLEILNTYTEIEFLEKALDKDSDLPAQLEEYIEEANKQIKFIPTYAEWRLWEPEFESDEPMLIYSDNEQEKLIHDELREFLLKKK